MEEVRTYERWLDWVSLGLGLWLFVMPFFGFMPLASVGAINAYIFGAILIVISVAALIKELPWEEWINVGIGLWLVASPFVLGFTVNVFAMWSFIVVGAFVAVDALWGALTLPPETHEPGGHHPTHA